MLRIVSLVPSLTETICLLGGTNTLVGRTRYCIHPKREVEGIPRIGGTKNPDIEAIRALAPTHVLLSKEENREVDYIALAQFTSPIVYDIATIAQAEAATMAIAKLLGLELPSRQLTPQAPLPAIPALYLMWAKPYMAAGGDTYISDMLEAGGFTNVLKSQTRYPTLPDLKHTIAEYKPAIILLSSEPFPFKPGHAQAIEADTGTRTIIVDGEPFSWYGARTPSAILEIQELHRQIQTVLIQ
jgi:ABC-type Fe3+-hydroxamate transport system substrate-binding protein